MKKRNKKYNKMKSITNLSNSLLNDFAIVFFAGGNDGKCILVNIKTFEQVPVTQTIANSITNLRHFWSIYMAVMLRDNQCGDYMRPTERVLHTECYQHELVDYLNAEHQALLKEQNQNHVVTAGWIATPKKFDFDDELAWDLFHKLGAWEFDAKWQNKLAS